MNNTSKKSKKLIPILVTILVFLYIFTNLWNIILKDIVVVERTHFKNYDSFYQQSVRNFFPSELPFSATDVKYYYYSGMLDEKWGVSFVVDDVEIEAIKKKYKSYYHDTMIISDAIIYVFDEPLSYDFLKTEKMEFLEKLIESELESYTILAYEKGCNEHSDVKSCILYNDKTNEFIIVFYDDKLFFEEE